MGHTEGILREPDEVITKDGERLYRYGENLFPSITTIIGHFEKEKLQGWIDHVGQEEADRVSKVATRKGTEFHEMIEDYLGPERGMSLAYHMPDITDMFNIILPALKNITRVDHLEIPLVSFKHEMAGRVDCIGQWMKTTDAIIDFKTANRPKEGWEIIHYFEQLAGYSIMYEEMTGKNINTGIIIMSNTLYPQVFKVDLNPYRELMLEKRERYRTWVATQALD